MSGLIREEERMMKNLHESEGLDEEDVFPPEPRGTVGKWTFRIAVGVGILLCLAWLVSDLRSGARLFIFSLEAQAEECDEGRDRPICFAFGTGI